MENGGERFRRNFHFLFLGLTFEVRLHLFGSYFSSTPFGKPKNFSLFFLWKRETPLFSSPPFQAAAARRHTRKRRREIRAGRSRIPLFFREKKKGNKVRACKFASVSLDPSSSGHRLGPRLVAQSECRLIGPLLWCPINRRSQHSCFLISTYSTLFCSLL